MKKHILIVCPYPENEVPGQRLKYEQYFECFRRNGYKISVSPFIEPRFFKILYLPGHYTPKIVGVLWGYAKRCLQIVRLPFYDGIYVSLYVTPFGTSFFERLFRLFSKRMIYDIDDLVYEGRASKYNYMVAPLRWSGKYFYLMKAADQVFISTPYLESVVRRYTSKIAYIPVTVNTERYFPVQQYSNDTRLVLGWSGSHSTAPYLRLLETVLRSLREQYDFRLLVIGAPDFRIEGLDGEAIPWNEATEVEDLQRIDIGLYPLPDEEWVLGKGGGKALQYMACGIPTVATAIGANFRVIEDGVSGFLVKSDEEWKARLGELMSDPDLRRRIGQQGRARVVKYNSVFANEPVYLRIFDEVF